MLKKVFNYPIFLLLFLSFIGMMGFGTIVKYHYDGGVKYQFLQKPVMLIAETPFNFKKIIKNKGLSDNVIHPINDMIYVDKKTFDKKNSLQPPHPKI